MTETTPLIAANPLIDDVANWLMDMALLETGVDDLVEGCFMRLHAAGIPLVRAQVAFRILHPLYGAVSMVWTPSDGMQVERFPANVNDTDDWRQSPGYYLISAGTPFMRRKLTGPEAIYDFSVLEDFRDQGATDYLGYMIGFDEQRRMGMVGSWLTNRESGFSDNDIRDLKRIQQRFAVALKLAVKEQIAQNALTAYLGEDAGNQVLCGQIHLGEVQSIEAAIWFSDMRDSTGLADRLSPGEYLDLLNRYFELSAGSVIAAGGQVLMLVGDGVLAIFPIGKDHFTAREASTAAITAARNAQEQLVQLRARDGEALHGLQFGIGLHIGSLQFGNIGVPERLQFTVVGPAANEVSRIEDITKTIGHPIAASRALIDQTGQTWRSHGLCELAGTSEPVEIMSPD